MPCPVCSLEGACITAFRLVFIETAVSGDCLNFVISEFKLCDLIFVEHLLVVLVALNVDFVGRV